MSVASGEQPVTQQDRFKASLRELSMSREVGLLVLIVVGCIIFSIMFPASFPTFGNFSAVARNLAVDAIMAVGMLVLMVSGVFDLSVGALFSMAGVVTGWMLKDGGFPVWAAILAGLAISALAGFINGFIVAKIRVNALITTLGTQQIYRGVAVLIAGPGIPFLPPTFARLGQSSFLGLQSPVWLMVGIVILFQYLLWKTRFFRQYYYIGGNPRAARLSGINVSRMQIIAFTLMGLLAGVAGMAFSSRLASAVSIAGDGAELRVITAVILGGASLSGGKGTVWGALIGVVFIALINNIMIIAQISSYWQNVVVGAVLILAVATDYLLRRTQ